MAESTQQLHEFIVSGVESGESDSKDHISVILTDARGGKVRLNLSAEMAMKLCSFISNEVD